VRHTRVDKIIRYWFEYDTITEKIIGIITK
jgi:hypothetical protein